MSDSNNPLPGDSNNPLPGDSNNPLPGDSNNPLPGDSNNPLPGDSNNPLPGDSNNPLPGDSNNPLPGDSNNPLPGDSNNPLPGDSNNPLPGDSNGTGTGDSNAPVVPPSSPDPVEMTLELFNNNFVVRVVEYKELVDVPTTLKVSYEVKCSTNNRVGVFITEVDTTTLSEGFTQSDVTTAAWDNLKTTVTAWAEVMFPKPQFTFYTIESTTDAISLQDFTDNFKAQIIRFELYPKVSPSSWCIGFYVFSTTKPGVNMFIDGNVGLDDYCNNVLCKTVAGAVWDSVKERICSWAASELEKPIALNTQFVPSTLTI